MSEFVDEHPIGLSSQVKSSVLVENQNFSDQFASAERGFADVLQIMPGLSETTKDLIQKIPVDSSVEHASYLLLGHFKRALQIAKKLLEMEEQTAIDLSVLNYLPVGLLPLNESGEVVSANKKGGDI